MAFINIIKANANKTISDSKINSLDDNNGNLTITCPSCNIGSINSNRGLISVAELSTIVTIQRNVGVINLMGISKIGSVHHNWGRIDLMDESSISSINHNSGEIVIGTSAVISTITANSGTISFGNNCTRDEVSENMGNIQLGQNCVIKRVSGKVGSIQCGLGCRVPVVATFTRNIQKRFISIANGFSKTVQSSGAIQKPNECQKQQLQQPQSVNQSAEPLQSSVNDELLCDICLENKKDTVFNCGHTCCENCAKTLFECHICRAKILQKIKFFL